MIDYSDLASLISQERDKNARLLKLIFDLYEGVDTSVHKPILSLWDFSIPRFFYVSQKFADALGMTVNEVMGANFTTLIAPENLAESMATYDKNKDAGGVSRIYNFYSPYIHKDGHKVDMWWDGVNDSGIGYGAGLVYLYDRNA